MDVRCFFYVTSFGKAVELTLQVYAELVSVHT